MNKVYEKESIYVDTRIRKKKEEERKISFVILACVVVIIVGIFEMDTFDVSIIEFFVKRYLLVLVHSRPPRYHQYACLVWVVS